MARRSATALIILLATATLAGCLDASSTTVQATERTTTGPETQATWRHHEQIFDMVSSQLSTPNSKTGFSQDNCANFEGDALRLHNVTADASWSAATPLAAQLDLGVVLPDFAHRFSGQGTSPRHLEVDAVELTGKVAFGHAFGFTVQTGSPGFTNNQPVTVVVSFDVLAVGPLKVQEGISCSIS